MANNTRGEALRQLTRAHDNLEWVGQHVGWFASTYEENHPELSKQADMILSACVEMQNAILRLKTQI